MLLESKWPEGGPRREPPFREKQGREAAGDSAPTDLLRGLGQFPLTSLNSFSQHKIQGDEAQFKGLLPGESAVREATQNTFRMKAQATRAAMTTAVITMATGNALGERQTSSSNKPRAGRQGGVLFPPTFSLVARLWPRGRAPEGRNGGRVTGRQPFLTWSCPDPPASAQLTQAKASPFLTQALLPSELLSCCSPPPTPTPVRAPPAQQPHSSLLAAPRVPQLPPASGSAHVTSPQTPPQLHSLFLHTASSREDPLFLCYVLSRPRAVPTT